MYILTYIHTYIYIKYILQSSKTIMYYCQGVFEFTREEKTMYNYTEHLVSLNEIIDYALIIDSLHFANQSFACVKTAMVIVTI